MSSPRSFQLRHCNRVNAGVDDTSRLWIDYLQLLVSKSRLVAANARTSMVWMLKMATNWLDFVVCSARSSLLWAAKGNSPISSRNRRCRRLLRANLPRRFLSAPVNAPRTWPNSSSLLGFQESQHGLHTQAGYARCDWWCRVRATNSLPTPVSPWIRILNSEGATIAMSFLSATMVSLLPISSPPSRSHASTFNSSNSCFDCFAWCSN